MPYSVGKSSTCPASKPHAVTRDDGTVVPGGCHATHEQALEHQRALMVNVPDAQQKTKAPKANAVMSPQDKLRMTLQIAAEEKSAQASIPNVDPDDTYDCPNCGNEVTVWTEQCPYCSTDLTRESEVETPGTSVGNYITPSGQHVPVEQYFARNFSKAQRDKAAKEGAALPDGTFPIYSGGDLDNAIQLARTPRQQAHIKKRAKALGQTNKIPDNWS